MTIELSPNSQELIKKLSASNLDRTSLLQKSTTTIEIPDLLGWFALTTKTKTTDEAFF